MDLTLDGIKQASNRLVLTVKRWQFGNKMQLAFLEDFYLLINDGIPANRAIDMMAQITTGLTREVATSISEKIAQGQPLADGMRDWFSINVVEIVRVGEAGGALSQTLRSAINMLSQRGSAIGAFIAALAYPTMVLITACIVIVYLKEKVFTQFAMLKPMSQWPASGIRLMNIAAFIENWWWLTLIVLIFIFFLLQLIMKHYVGPFRPTLDLFPPFSFYKQLTSARFLETLGLLVANGVVFKTAIKVMQYQPSPYLGSHLVMMEHLLSLGKTNIADVLKTGLVSQPDLMRLKVMAEVKGFEHGLIRMGIRGAEESTATLKFISRIIGGVLLTFGALMIIIIVQGIYLTGMSMST